MAYYTYNAYYDYDDVYQATPQCAYGFEADKAECMGYPHDSCTPATEYIAGVTTLCIRNLPCKVDQSRMNYELWRLGFGGTYDFLYLPRRSCGKCLGYGFVNFRVTEDAIRFAKVFDGFRFEDIRSSKRGYAEPSRLQGYDANVYQLMDAIFNAKRGMIASIQDNLT
eukprot:TRINITY_DN12858_c0_g1_i1.p1 TRINITY_DN12858_c0_g1~~TRINITY_DN12858_c0_g1_i1.p1  ORF type:complete len:192 (-),score=26.15 TRINITY_DN12858_c0_g1_i1:92-592(-)